MDPIRVIESRSVVIPRENVDTDQIIPARFLKVTDKKGLGKVLFCDWRYDAGEKPKPDFILNKPEAQGCHVLVAGDNFGCGSSREHAPWALVDAGFRAVISTSVADIFRSNSLKNGFLPIVTDAATHAKLLAAPGTSITIDLERGVFATAETGEVPFRIEAFARHCLLHGVDELGYLLAQSDAIAAYEARR